MPILGIDVGSSSVKAGILERGRVVGRISREYYSSRFDGVRAEVDPAELLQAISKAIDSLGRAARGADAIGLSVMSPAWIAMDRAGKPLTPIITHQDRRSLPNAIKIERRIGKSRHLRIAGARPVPGGISSTTAAWFTEHHPKLMKRADLIGHLNTFLHRHWTGRRVIDLSNASFTGLFETIRLRGWSDELCHAAGISPRQLPDIYEANTIAGHLLPKAARELGLPAGMPVIAGWVDTSGAVLLGGAERGQLTNVCGSTDVLALGVDRPRPHEKLLTRALGIGRKWLSVGTLAASGSSLEWMHREMFADLPSATFYNWVKIIAGKKSTNSGITFEPYLAGERTSLEQKRASFSGLALSSSRTEMLRAVIDALAAASAARLELLASRGVKIARRVITSGAAAASMHDVLHRDWPGRWSFHFEPEATLRGLSLLRPKQSEPWFTVNR